MNDITTDIFGNYHINDVYWESYVINNYLRFEAFLEKLVNQVIIEANLIKTFSPIMDDKVIFLYSFKTSSNAYQFELNKLNKQIRFNIIYQNTESPEYDIVVEDVDKSFLIKDELYASYYSDFEYINFVLGSLIEFCKEPSKLFFVNKEFSSDMCPYDHYLIANKTDNKLVIAKYKEVVLDRGIPLISFYTRES